MSFLKYARNSSRIEKCSPYDSGFIATTALNHGNIYFIKLFDRPLRDLSQQKKDFPQSNYCPFLLKKGLIFEFSFENLKCQTVKNELRTVQLMCVSQKVIKIQQFQTLTWYIKEFHDFQKELRIGIVNTSISVFRFSLKVMCNFFACSRV